MSLMLHFRIKTLSGRNEVQNECKASVLDIPPRKGRQVSTPLASFPNWPYVEHLPPRGSTAWLSSGFCFVLFCFLIYQVFRLKKKICQHCGRQTYIWKYFLKRSCNHVTLNLKIEEWSFHSPASHKKHVFKSVTALVLTGCTKCFFVLYCAEKVLIDWWLYCTIWKQIINCLVLFIMDQTTYFFVFSCPKCFSDAC